MTSEQFVETADPATIPAATTSPTKMAKPSADKVVPIMNVEPENKTETASLSASAEPAQLSAEEKGKATAEMTEKEASTDKLELVAGLIAEGKTSYATGDFESAADSYGEASAIL